MAPLHPSGRPHSLKFRASCPRSATAGLVAVESRLPPRPGNPTVGLLSPPPRPTPHHRPIHRHYTFRTSPRHAPLAVPWPQLAPRILPACCTFPLRPHPTLAVRITATNARLVRVAPRPA